MSLPYQIYEFDSWVRCTIYWITNLDLVVCGFYISVIDIRPNGCIAIPLLN